MLRVVIPLACLLLAGCVDPVANVHEVPATVESSQPPTAGTVPDLEQPAADAQQYADVTSAAASEGPAPAKPVVVSGALFGADPTLAGEAACGGQPRYSRLTQGQTWDAYWLPQDLSGWTVRIAPAGFTAAFAGGTGGIVPQDAKQLIVCNHGATFPGFTATFLAPERRPDAASSYTITGTLHAADPTWRDTGVCRGYGDARRVVHDQITAVTRVTHVLPTDLSGATFIIDGEGVVSDINGRMWGDRAGPIGFIPDGAHSINVCSTSDVPVSYTLTIGLPALA